MWEYLGFGAGLLNFRNYKSTRIGYASSTTVDDLASSERCSHMITVSAPMQGNIVCAKTSPSVDASPAPHSPCSPSHLASPQPCVTLHDFAQISSLSSLYRDIASLIARLTLKSHTIDQRRLASVGYLTHDNTTHTHVAFR